MDAVLRAAAIYLFLMLVMRISGKRTLAQVTTFDFVLLTDESDVLEAARELQGLQSMKRIKYAVLERSGGISIVPS